MRYDDFLAGKRVPAPSYGLDDVGAVHESLYPFQRQIVEWAVRRGRAAVFADCGLGKTRIQLEWARLTGERTLILAPLAVAHQTAAEGREIGVDVTVCRSRADVGPGVNIANYEMLQHFDPADFGAVVLDESSILKAFDGKTKQRLTEAFADTRYRLCCTATPAPNDYTELGNHAEFLGAMPANQMLARFFVNDGFKSNSFRLKRHAVTEFWRWVHTWAVSLEKPSDLGEFDDDGFILPAMSIKDERVTTPHDPRVTGTLFRMPSMSATTMHAEMRASAKARAELAAEIVARSDEPCVVWCHTNYEADELVKVMPDAVDVRGAETVAAKERKLEAFAAGEIRTLITKPTVAGFGMNWQHCPRAVFVGLSYSYEQFYQATRRIWRFGQRRPVSIHVILAESEQHLLDSLNRKRADHDSMRHAMAAAMRDVQRSEDYQLQEGDVLRHDGDGFDLYHGDCVRAMERVDDESVGLSVFSPPFSNLFVYSDELADMGNSANHAEFFDHFGYLARELLRVTIPMRLCAVHCTDLTRNKWKDGVTALFDFPGGIIKTFEDAGWTYHSRVTVWKSPVTEMQRTKANGLLYKQLRKDSSASRVGMPDYVLVFRKWAEGEPEPIHHTPEDFPLDQWQEWASPVWMSVNQTNVLQYRGARGDKDERHICPLQLDIIERCIKLWSNPGDLVLSPFAGIGSEGVVALQEGRRFVGAEIKREYFDVAVNHLTSAVSQQSMFQATEGAAG